MIHAIAADAEHVYFRTLKHVYRVPLAGGQATVIAPGPTISLSSKGSIFLSDERLLTQALGEAVFMALPKSGGKWSTIIDVTNHKQEASARLALEAEFDGSTFYWAQGGTKARGPSTSATLRSVALSGGAPKTLYRRAGAMDEVTKAGDHIVFMHTEPASPEQLRIAAAYGRQGLDEFPLHGEQHLMSLPAAGGQAKTIARISGFAGEGDVMLGSDGSTVYVSGDADGDGRKGGVYKVDANGSTLERLDERRLHGRALIAGSNVIFAGNIELEPRSGTLQQAVFSMPRGGNRLTLVACLTGYVSIAYAVAGKYLLMSLFREKTQLAAIAKIALP